MPHRATLSAIDRVHGVPLLQSGIEVDESQLDDAGIWRPPESPSPKQA